MKNTGQIIDIEHWERKEEYLFFRTFFSPLISVTVEVDCTAAYEHTRQQQLPFSLYYMHAAVMAANHIPEFRYRQEGEKVVLYDHIDLFTPIQAENGTYRSVLLDAHEDWTDFYRAARPIVETAKRGEGEAHAETGYGKDILLISVNPWYRFTSVQLSVPAHPHQNIPIFTVGKMEEKDGKRTMPLAMSVNHGFVSGYQIGQYIREFQRLLDRTEI